MSGEVVGWAMKQTTGSPAAKLVLVKLADNSNEQGLCWPSIDLLVEHTELGQSTVYKHLAALETMGLIAPTEVTRKGQLLKAYQLSLPAALEEEIPPRGIDRTSKSRIPPGGKRSPPEGKFIPSAGMHIEEPSIEPSGNRHSDAHGARESEIIPAAFGEDGGWTEARAAFAQTWPDGFPADGEAACRAEFEKIAGIRAPEIIIGCIRAHGAELALRKAKRAGMPGPFAFKQPRNWLKQGDWQGYIPAAERAAIIETEETRALARVQATLGAGVVEILKRVGVTFGELARFEGMTFEDGPPPRFITARPFQAARLRQRAQKLEFEFAKVFGDGLLIIEAGAERKSA